ncbi:MAG: YeeE/YedE thiosulfate transporter family protein [Candidatus Caldarchaeum sp.]
MKALQAGVEQKLTSSAILVVVLASVAVYLAAGYVQHAFFIVFGLLYGYAIYKSRICFATAFYGDYQIMTAILLSMTVASVGSAFILAVGLNAPPAIPVGPHILVGSFLFGLAMPFAGGCITGVMYRFGAGQAKALSSLAGILVGNFVGAFFMWGFVEPFLDFGRGFSLYQTIGPLGGLALNLSLIALLLAILQRRGGRLNLPSFSTLVSGLRLVFKTGWWPPWLGGLVMAAVFIVQFALYSSLSVQLPIARLALWTASPLVDVEEVAWAGRWGLREPFNDPLLLLVIALVVGAMLGSTTSGSFGCYRGGRPGDMAVGFAAGLFMGVAVWIAVGCNISGFWASVSTLRPEGWMYAAGMFLGARAGLKLFTKLYA